MLRMCREGQWSVGQLDFSHRPRPMSREDEIAVVQYFTDMARIERLAAALFVEQERRVDDPVLKEIFATFVVDEMRHSHVAQMLADHYDVHRYAVYRTTPALERFFPHFIEAIVHLSDEVANAYITCGELLLDIALLRSIDGFVADPLSARAMALINRDESRHIAVDYHMVGHYASDAYQARKATLPRRPLHEQIAGARAFGALLLWGKPFFRDVFFAPMERTDPTGRRVKEAFRRIQLLGSKPGLDGLPIVRFWRTMQELYNRPGAGRFTKRTVARVIGMEPAFMEILATGDELTRARRMSFDELAVEALDAKYH